MMKREKTMPQSIYDLIEVYFGNEVIMARPYSFTEDANGDLINAKLASTSCPKCGHGVIVKLILGRKAICENCNYGRDDDILNDDEYQEVPFINQHDDDEDDDLEEEMMKLLKDDDGISGIRDTITIDEQSGNLKTSCPFIDPIELGTFVKDEI